VRRRLDALRRAAASTENVMPFLIDAVRAYATLGEICGALRDVFGAYQEQTHI
jgi:methylmalonyl-CoA mutase, N-terminal domain